MRNFSDIFRFRNADTHLEMSVLITLQVNLWVRIQRIHNAKSLPSFNLYQNLFLEYI
jgi:hypothetical protein